MKQNAQIDSIHSNPDVLPLIRKILYVQPLNAEEINALNKLHNHPHSFDELTTVINYGAVHKKSYIVTEGWAYRYYDLNDGSRQIINFYLPGDIISPYALVMPKTPYCVDSITCLKVCQFEPEELIELFVTQPKLGLIYGWLLGREDSMMADQIVRNGRRSAYKSVAHLLLEIHHRLKIVGLAEEKNGVFPMPIAQHYLSDALGLSLVHINRTLRKLRVNKLIDVTHKTVSLLDIDELKKITEYNGYYLDQIKNINAIIENNTIDNSQETTHVA